MSLGLALSSVGKYRGACALTLVVLALQAVSHLATPLYYNLIFDRAIAGADASFLAMLLGGAAAVFAVMVLLEGVQGRLSATLGMRAANDLRLRVFEHLQRLPVDFYARTRTGDVMARFVGDLAAIERALTVSIPKVALNALVVLLCVGALFFVTWRLALLALVVLPLVAVLPRALTSRAAQAAYARREDEERLSRAVQESVGAATVIRAFSLERFSIDRFQDVLRGSYDSGVRASVLAAYVEKTSNLGVILGQVVIAGAGGWMVVHALLTPGEFVAFLGLLLNIGYAIGGLTAFVPDLLQATGSMRRIAEVLAEPVPAAHGAAPFALSRQIRFEALSFSYTGDQPQLSDLSFTIGAGESVALVGRSGSGKSTVLNLLLRFYDPSTGAITVDGRTLKEFSPASLRASIGCVFQSALLFDDTVRENIRYGRLDATDVEVEAAASAAEVHDAIVALPQGYDTRVGELGGSLSGGQRQRIALARAIVRDPAILLLDEATSALDPTTEAAVNATLARLAKGRTVLSVTHRLAVAALVDRILVLDHGRLVEQGSHDELLARNGAYAAMWRTQSSFDLNPDGTAARLEAMFLQTIPLFAGVDVATLRSVADSLVSELHEADTTLIEEGEIGEKFYIVVRGRVAVTQRRPDGSPATVGIREDGDFFGEIALLTRTPRTATVRAVERSLVLTLTRARFDALLAQAPALRAHVMTVAAERGATLTAAP